MRWQRDVPQKNKEKCCHAAFRLHVPALRERPEDILPIFLHFIRRHRPEIAGAVSRNKKEIYQTLVQESFPGNVRELENVARRFCQIFRPGESLKKILEACRQRRIALAQEKQSPGDLKQTLQTAEKVILQDLLKRYRNKADLSAPLRLDRSTLWRKMKKYGLSK